MVKIKRNKRRILRSGNKRITRPQEDLGPVYSTASQRIMAMPAYRKILEKLREGASVNTIVGWCEREAWLGDMSPSTLTQYLYKFKNECAELIESAIDPAVSYDHYVGTSIPEIDPDIELDKLIAIQKRRVSVDTQTEITIGKLLQHTHKEIAVLGELLKQKAGVSNNPGNGAKTGVGDLSELRQVQINEADQDKLTSLTDRLFKEINNAHSTQKEKGTRSKAKTAKASSR